MQQASRRDFVIRLASVAAVVGAGTALTGCLGDGGDSVPPQFSFGVASGDPLVDRVMLWTHAQFPDSSVDVALTWEVASDAAFTAMVSSGSAVAAAATGHTVKADAGGLAPGREYFYRFRFGVHSSPVGRTRTLPAAGASQVSMAVMSCSNFPAGFFHAYSEVTRSGAQFALHLGDYIYEYPTGVFTGLNAPAERLQTNPATELITLSDYRRRYAQYRSDPDSKVMHAALPLIAIWDDHELANNSWVAGAQEHDPSTEGAFNARRDAAIQAWHEWLPVRSPNPANLRSINRSFDFGGLLALHLLETRLLARDRPLEVQELVNPATAAAARATLASATRTMMGREQLQWLQGRMAASRATWEVLGQPVLMARMTFPVSVLQHLNPANTSPEAVAAGQRAVTEYLTALATQAQAPASLTPAQRALLDPVQNPQLGYNLDAWDGYPVEREMLLGMARQLNKRLVVLAGDTHNAWASRLTLMDGTVVGNEFATQSISSPGLEEYLIGLTPVQTQQIFRGVVGDLRFADTGRRGFLLMEFTPQHARGTWHFVSSVKTRTYTLDTSQSLSVSA